MIGRLVLLFCLVLSSFSNVFGQNKPYSRDKGLVVYTLGSDTIIVQYFEYQDQKFRTTILDLTGKARKYEGEGILDKTGDLIEVRSRLYEFNSTGNWFLSRETSNIFNGDSSIFTATSNGKLVARRSIAGKGIVVNTDPCSFYVFPYMGFFASEKINDTLNHCHLVFGECRAYHVTRVSNNELSVGSGVMGNIKLFLKFLKN